MANGKRHNGIPVWARLDENDRFFIPVYTGMLRSPAWTHLSKNARAIYLAMRTKYGPKNNYSDTFSISYSEITILTHVRRGSIKRHIDELTSAGFIKIEMQGMKTVNEYKFISDWKKKE